MEKEDEQVKCPFCQGKGKMTSGERAFWLKPDEEHENEFPTEEPFSPVESKHL